MTHFYPKHSLFWGILFFIFSWTCSNSLQAQIFPPDFICTKSDTLIWTLPNNTCGTFSQYTIFSSQSIDGPYQVLATITDPNQTNFVHEGSLSQTWYYYLQSDYNCPNETAISSDTLDNRLPAIAPISAISVEGDAIRVSWSASPSPEVTQYIVYRITDLGTTPIATVIDEFSYLDTDANPSEKSESYYVLASDACENTSIFDEPQRSILMETSVSSCDQSVSLNWNLYDNWANGIDRQEVWVSVNGATAEIVETITATATSYTFLNANDATEYCFFIKAVEANTFIEANSNEVCLNLDIVQPNRNLFLKNVSVTADNQVEISWQWDANAEINQRDILRSSDPNATLEVIDNQTIAPPLPSQSSYIDPDVLVNKEVYVYQVSTTDDCEAVAISNMASTILLSGTAQATQTNLLNWTPLNWENGTVVNYQLIKIVDDMPRLVSELSANENSFEEPVDPNNLAESNAEYYLLANIQITLPNGEIETVSSRSNTIRIEQFANIQAPNAFAPAGNNAEFRPVITFGENADYQLLIYNKYGGIVFESKDIATGWTGRNEQGQILKSGVYVYYIRLTQDNGRNTEAKGTVLLLQ